MLVQVKKVLDPDCWYSEMIGEIFTCFMIPSSPYIFFNTILFFYPQDVTEIKTTKENINIPTFLQAS